MRNLTVAAICSALTTLVAGLALRAGDPVTAVLAVAAVLVLVTWVTTLHSTPDTSGLALGGPVAAVTLVLVQRHRGGLLLPLVAAQVVGAVLGGLAVLALDGALAGVLVWEEPSLLVTGVGAGVVGLVAAWAVLATDSDGTPLWVLAPVLVAGAVLGLSLAAAAQPAVLLGLATAGLLGWPTALVAAAATVLGAVIGTYAMTLVAPATP